MRTLLAAAALAVMLSGCANTLVDGKKGLLVATEAYNAICGPVLTIVRTGTPEQRRKIEPSRLNCIAASDAIEVGNLALATSSLAAVKEQR